VKLQSLPPGEQLAAVMGRIYRGGMTTLSGGNLSLVDEEGTLWITPAGVDKGNLTGEDVVCLRANGTVAGTRRPSSELPFHRAIYARRPDLRAVLHAHPPALVAFSIAHRVPDTTVLPRVHALCGPVGSAPYALTGSEELGERIAATFARGCDAALLENHGVVTGGRDLLEALHRLESLEICARVLLNAHRLGEVRHPQADSLDLHSPTLPAFDPGPPGAHELALRRRVAQAARRACATHLMTGAVGVVSALLEEDIFLITPVDGDRCTLEPEDVVQVHEGRRERGAYPDPAAARHRAVYRRHPHVRAIGEGLPVHAAAYAVTGQSLNTRTIPESYILLRDVARVPFDGWTSAPERVAEVVARDVPVVLLDHGAVLATGKDVLQALDRLEVAEFTARSLLDVAPLGELAPMDEACIRRLREVFPL
jgi:L-fuculose-phosphate aldolase